MTDSQEEAGQEEAGPDPLGKIVRDSNRILAFTALAVSSALVVLVLVAGWFGYHFYNQLKTTQDQINAAKKSTCDFYYVIGTIEVIDHGPQKSGKALIRLIVDSRTTYEKRVCGHLPSPSPALIRLSREYGIPVK